MYAYLYALGLALVFAAIEFFASTKTESQALLADAAHVLSDAVIYGIGFWGAWRVMRLRSGHPEILFGKVAAVAQLVFGISIVVFGGARVFSDTPFEDTELLLGVGVAGLCANIVMYMTLARAGIGHGHHHGGHNAHEDVAGRVALTHLFGDMAGSVAVVAIAVALMFGAPQSTLFWVDGVVAMTIGAWLSAMAYRLLRGNAHHHH